MTELVRVGEVLAQVRTRITLSGNTKYAAIGIKSFGKGIFHYPPQVPESLSKLRYFQVPINALAISNIKAWEGALALTSEIDREAVASNRFLFYQPRSDEFDIRYFLYYFLSERGLSLIGKASPGSADRNRTLGVRAFENLLVPLPSAEEQRRIAGKLDATLSRVRSIQKLQATFSATLATLAESLIAQATGKTDETVRLGELLTLERAPATIDSEATYRTIGIRSFGKGFIHHPPTVGENLSKLNYFKFRVGALALSNLMAWEGGITVTHPEDTHYIASNRFFFYQPNDDRVNVSYLRHFLLTRRGQTLIASACSAGAERNRTLGRKRFEYLVIPLPPRSEQDRAARILDALSERVTKVHSNPALDSLQPSMLNAAFTGQL